MFVTEDQARAKFAQLLEQRPMIRNTIGTHLAEVLLEPAHGRQTAPNGGGHFDVHEYAGVDLVSCTKVVGEL